MKTLLTRLKISFLLSICFINFSAVAKPVAQVVEMKGQVFLISPDGGTKSLKLNDHVEEKSELMVGENGSITLNDYYDATYHLIGGSHLKFFDKSVQLKKGKTWIQSLNARHPLALTTANGHVGFWKGEFITTFDQSSSRSQFLVVNGEVDVSNVLDKNYKRTVSAGTFTMIDPEVEEGAPRTPTKVGLDSLNKALAEFKALPQQMKIQSMPEVNSRSIASSEDESLPTKSKGEIIFISKGGKMNRLPNSDNTAYSYFRKKVVSRKKTSDPKVTIRFFGMSKLSDSANTQERNPASIVPSMPRSLPKKIGTDLNIDPDFQESLRIQKGKQPNRPKDLDSLIQDLKSY